VALLVLLARATGTGIIAADLGTVTGDRAGWCGCTLLRHGLLLFGIFAHTRHGVMLELHALGQFLGLLAQPRFLFGRIFAAYLHMAEDTNGIVLDRVEHLLEQAEGFALVFL